MSSPVLKSLSATSRLQIFLDIVRLYSRITSCTALPGAPPNIPPLLSGHEALNVGILEVIKGPARQPKASLKLSDPNNVAKHAASKNKKVKAAAASSTKKAPAAPRLVPAKLAAPGKVAKPTVISRPPTPPTSSPSTSSSGSAPLTKAEKAHLADLNKRKREAERAAEAKRQEAIHARADKLKFEEEANEDEDEDDVENASPSPASDDEKLRHIFGPSASNGYEDENAKQILMRRYEKTWGRDDELDPDRDMGGDDEETFIKAEQEEMKLDPHADEEEDSEEEDSEEDVMQAEPAAESDNEMDTEDVTPATPLKKRRRQSTSTNSSPLAKHQRKDRLANSPQIKLNRSSVQRRAYKVTRSRMSPRQGSLADISKKMARRRAAIEDAYPASDDRPSFNVNTLHMAANDSEIGSEEHQATLIRLRKNPQALSDTAVYAGYARDALLNSCINRARQDVEGVYGLPGKLSQSSIRKRVLFLAENGVFKFGEIDLENETYNERQPWGSSIFSSLPRSQFVTGKGTADSEVFRYLTQKKLVPREIFVLVATVYEFAILQWRTGTLDNAEFTSAVRTRYLAHGASWDLMMEEMPTYTLHLQKKTFERIMTHSNKGFVLDQDANDMAKVDFQDLEAEALAEQEEEERAEAAAEKARAEAAAEKARVKAAKAKGKAKASS
ncbi:hypothetical protein BDZ89DRAFT_1046187 [Hymenopellis radicata]|nr:hypothetical protein BDZ89DRAFT_1046187 [Hymenopellis radicata]